MSWIDTLKGFALSVASDKSEVAAVETTFNELAETAAAFVPSAAPIVAAVESVEKVVGVAVASVTDPLPPLPAPAPGLDSASVAVKGVVAASADVPEIASRLANLEQAFAAAIPVIVKAGSHLGVN